MNAIESKKVEQHWSLHDPVQEGGQNPPNFYLSPLLQSYHKLMIWGPEIVSRYPQSHPFEIYVNEYVQKPTQIRRILSLCCGFGYLERMAFKLLPNIEYSLGVDLAGGALKVAREKAEAEGMSVLNYERADLNSYHFPTADYDLVIANGALHHLSNLTHILDGIHNCLKPNGFFYACEYCGPSHQAHSPRQIELINAAAFLVPPEMRRRRAPFSYLKGKNEFNRKLISAYTVASADARSEWNWSQKMIAKFLKVILGNQSHPRFGLIYSPANEYLQKTDPSEGVCAPEIIPNARRVFGDSLQVRPFGGGILQYALDEKFYKTFEPANPKHVAILEILCQLESKLMEANELGVENAYLFARKG